MRVEPTIAGLDDALVPLRRQGAVGFVPTMGALHAGHGRLIDTARAECQAVIVSIFVNPLQFDRADDLDRYPRTLEADLEICRSSGVDVVFVPSATEVYPVPPACTVDVGHLADFLCGPRRPGHFKGVATVVLKLLQMVTAGRAYFGEKDAQQLAIVKRMVRDFNVPTVIVGVPTVREPDGLALSSRNRHLTASERELAPSLHRALLAVERAIHAGETTSETIVGNALAEIPSPPALRLEYLELVDPADLQPVSVISRPVLAAGALWVGPTRLIDNIYCTPQPSGKSPTP